MSKALDRAYRAATAWIDGLDERPAAARATRDDLAAIFGGPLPELGTRSEEVVEWLTRHAGDGMLGSAGGRFFAWVIGGGVESALAADWMVATWDQNAALYACSPAAFGHRGHSRRMDQGIAGSAARILLRLHDRLSARAYDLPRRRPPCAAEARRMRRGAGRTLRRASVDHSGE